MVQSYYRILSSAEWPLNLYGFPWELLSEPIEVTPVRYCKPPDLTYTLDFKKQLKYEIAFKIYSIKTKLVFLLNSDYLNNFNLPIIYIFKPYLNFLLYELNK